MFSDAGFYFQSSFTNTSNTTWGAYAAASWTGAANDTVYMASQYSNGTWATKIAAVKYKLTTTG